MLERRKDTELERMLTRIGLNPVTPDEALDAIEKSISEIEDTESFCADWDALNINPTRINDSDKGEMK